MRLKVIMVVLVVTGAAWAQEGTLWTPEPRFIPKEQRRAPNLPPRPPSEPEAGFRMFHPFRVQDGLTFSDGERTVRVEGLVAPGPDSVCQDAKGRRWACGQQARMALYRLLSHASLKCLEEGKSPPEDPLPVRCRLDTDRDLASELVRAGWVGLKNPNDERFRDAVKARCRGEGDRAQEFSVCPAKN